MLGIIFCVCMGKAMFKWGQSLANPSKIFKQLI
ncbi:hypothetical protein LINPERPRIM_LOCUS27237 [Linum perenne]